MEWPAPVAGWVSNRALSDPKTQIEGPGAATLDNFFPKSTGVALRRGKARYATLNEALPIRSLFTYHSGAIEQMFAADAERIYDVSNVLFSQSVELSDGEENLIGDDLENILGWESGGSVVSEDYTSDDWSVIQFATTGGIYLIGVNGADTGFIYDGDRFYPNIAGGVTQVNYDGLSEDFSEGETVTGGTSGATGTIWRQDPATETTGNLFLTNVTGTFEDDEEITGETTGAADVIGAPVNAVPGMDFGDLTSADMSFVWAYKSRLYFVEKESLTAWYLDVDSIGGEATAFPMGGIFPNGGSLMFGQPWSLESGGSGGLSEQNVFVTSEGEVAIFQGDNPGEVATWSKVGVYRIGSPLGKRAYIRGGGDLAIATTVGLVPLSKAISLDVTALNVATVSYRIADAWTEAVSLRGRQDWQAIVWPEQKMALVAPPDMVGSDNPVVFVSNTETGAWARFTNWEALCFAVYGGRLFFGSPAGCVYQAMAGGFDDNAPYTGVVVPLFEDMGTSFAMKIGKMVRARVKANVRIVDRCDILADFDTSLAAAPDATPAPASNEWGSGVWGQSTWDATFANIINQPWNSAGAVGYALAPCYQVTSGAPSPLDVELIDFQTLHTTAEAVT
ncbi:hypothetical protein [Qipengyuania sp. MTN3-11]|uniref:hypothetical protein n=1 Tax=Qipengyuania sp. MTN3-11 TaxID=3056557 RepID=UPI0036F27242